MRHEVGFDRVQQMLARVQIALRRPFVIVEGDAGRDDVDQREAAVRERGFQNRHQMFLVAREPARYECRSDAEREQHGIDGRHPVGFALLALRTHIRRCRELALGEPVHAVVFDHVQHADVPAYGMAQMAEADGQRIAVSGNADVSQLAVGRVRAGCDRRHAPVRRVEAVRAARRNTSGVFDEHPMPLSLAMRCGGVDKFPERPDHARP